MWGQFGQLNVLLFYFRILEKLVVWSKTLPLIGVLDYKLTKETNIWSYSTLVLILMLFEKLEKIN